MNTGKIVQVIGPVVDVEFPDQLPAIYNAVTIEYDLPLQGKAKLTLEVQQHLGDHWVRTVAMSTTDGLKRGKESVLIIDEAQDLTDELLEQIRLLSNLETDNRKLLQIVLLGQPELRGRLNNPRLRQLRQRITVRYHLPPLKRFEVTQYVQHRLHVSGGNGTPYFTRPALWRVHHYSQGIPRLVNAVCDKALLAGFVQQSERIDFRMVGQAVRELEGQINA
jgi:general secretion pathway protein A